MDIQVKLRPTTDDALLVPLSDGKVIMGLWPVLFGWRVRAGYVGEQWYHLDWCCGDDIAMIWVTYEMVKYLLSTTDINTLPPHSNIKPWYHDPDFGENLVGHLDGWQGVHIIVNRPNLAQLRDEYMRKIEPLRQQ